MKKFNIILKNRFILNRFIFLILIQFTNQIIVTAQSTILVPDTMRFIQLPDSIQRYYSLSNEAEYLLFKKQYKNAIVKYNDAFKILEPRVAHVLSIINACYYAGNHKQAVKWIKYGAVKYGITLTVLEYLDSLVYSKYNHLDLRNEFGKFNSDPGKVQERTKLSHYTYNDRFFRSQLSDFNFICLDQRNSFKLALMYDSAFATPFFKSLIVEYNFPDARDLGYTGEIEFHILNRHYFIEKSIFDSALMRGKITPYYYASIVDYHYNWDFDILETDAYKGGPLKTKKDFGLNMNKLQDGSFIMVLPDDYEHVDERRIAIGLPPLWKYALMNGYKLPQQYIDWLNANKIYYDK